MPIVSLELASTVALTTGQRRSQHLRSASAVAVAVVVSLAMLVGVGYVGPMAAVLAATTLVALCFAGTRARWVQRSLDWHALQRARARRDFLRRDALCQAAAARRVQYLELRGLVEGVERPDPVEARRLELQELLDYFVRLAVSHQRCRESLRIADGAESPAPAPSSEAAPAGHRRDIAARRLQHRDETTARLGRMADEIDAVDDLIRLVAQRTACASFDTLIEGEGEIDRRLVELDEVEAALVQISA